MDEFDAMIMKHVRDLSEARFSTLEDLCRRAMILQDFDYLERLVVVSFPWHKEIPDTVASMLMLGE